MRSAQMHQDIDPAEVGFAAEQRDPRSGYAQLAQDVFARLGERFNDMKSTSSSQIQPPLSRSSHGSLVLRGIFVLLLVVGASGAALAWQWPRSEAVRSLVAQWAPQSVLNLLPAVDAQDASSDAASADNAQGVAAAGSTYRSMSDSDQASGGIAPMDQQQLIEKLVRDVANLQQAMDQLRAGQDQMLRMMLRTPVPTAQARAAVVVPRTSTTGLAANGLAPPVARRAPLVPPPPRY